MTVTDPSYETRTVAAQFEMRDDTTTGAPIFEGYASVFDTPYNLGPFWEQVDKRAFNRTLSMNPDVRLLVDHEGQPLARTKSGTLALHADTQGLHARATLDPTDPDVQRLLPKMRRGDLDQMSFSFRVAGPNGDTWDYGSERTLRTLQELSLADQDVSIVTYPASTTTTAAVRSARGLFVERMAREMRTEREFAPRDLARLRKTIDEIVAENRSLGANDTRASLAEAVSEAYGSKGFAYVVDYDDSNVYFTVYSYADDDEDTYAQAYTLAADGMATLNGDASQVRPRTTWTPITDPDGDDQTLTPDVDTDDLMTVARNARSLDLSRRIAVALSL